MNPLAGLCDLRKRGEGVVALGDVGIKDSAIMLRHFERAVTQEALESEGVPSAVDQILACEGVAEHVARGLLHASAQIVAGDSLTQGAFCQLSAELIAEEIVLWLAAANLLIFLKDGPHLLTQRKRLNLAVLVVAEDHLLTIQKDIAVLDVADRRGTATRVQKKVDDDPVSIDGEAASRRRAAE